MSSLLSRLNNLWRLSEFEPRSLGSEPPKEGTQIVQLIKKPTEKAQFIPRVKVSPVQAITEEQA